MDVKDRTAQEWFREFQPRYREVLWQVCGFNGPTHRLYFAPRFLTARWEWRDILSIDLAQTDVECTVHYNSRSHESPKQQLVKAVWEEVTQRCFAGRRFYVDPVDFSGNLSKPFAVKFSYEGEQENPIKGLDLNAQMKVMDWQALVPGHSLEGRIIRLVLEEEEHAKERAKAEQIRAQLPTPEKTKTELALALADLRRADVR